MISCIGKRAAAGEVLRRGVMDVVVIGGGIVGAGVARDAAMRGLRTALVEQHDFAFGTSSRSSRLLHGGLRYLAQGRIGLVREASVEKRVIHTIAPHLADPLAFVFPTYRCAPWDQWAFWKLRIGVKIYDLLCGGRNLGRSTSLSAKRTAEYLPGLQDAGLTGAVRYFDGLTQDARLVIDTLRSAEKSGCCLSNYLRLVSASAADGLWHAELRDELSGERFSVASHCVVNATGPWGDKLGQSSVRLRPTKGVHLVVDRQRLPVPDAVVLTEGTRILFAIPWGDRVILGTTDTDYVGPLDRVHAGPSDIHYILDVVNRSFPTAKLTTEDVISFWAGLRPLVADPDGNPSDISRSHEIRMPSPGWVDVAGGKLTTYRLMAEQAVDLMEKHLGLKRTASRTATIPLLEEKETEGVSGIVPPDVTREAVEHYCAREWAVHLDDVMLRRGGWHYYQRNADEVAAQVSEWMAEFHAWDPATMRLEMKRYRRMTEAGSEDRSNNSVLAQGAGT